MALQQVNTQWQEGIEPRAGHEPRTTRPPFTEAFTDYDRLRHQSAIGALSRRSYHHAFEPGCGRGELTAQLAGMCDRVTAMDISRNAAAHTRTRCAHRRNVQVYCADIRSSGPEEPVDLIVFSELGFYFSAPELTRIARSLAARMVEGGEFIAIHGLHRSVDHVLHADAVHCQLLANLPLCWVRGERDGGVRIDAWRLLR